MLKLALSPESLRIHQCPTPGSTRHRDADCQRPRSAWLTATCYQYGAGRLRGDCFRNAAERHP